MKQKKLYLIFILLQLNIFAIDTITIEGTGSSQKLLRILAVQFEKDNPNTHINIPNSIGSGGGIKNTALEKSDLGRVARKLRKREEKYNLNYMLFAYSPVVFVTNESVKNLSNLNEQQIVDIYTGKIKIWENLDAKKGKIYVASREIGDASKDILDKYLKKFAKISNPIGEIQFSSPKMLKVVTQYKNTIGYLAYPETVGTTLNVLNINNIEPNIQNIKNNTYPFYVPLGIVYKNNIKPLAKKFLHFLESEKAKKIIFKNKAIPK